MKRCPYCGKQYPNGADICPADQQTLEDPAATRLRAVETRAQGEAAFNARLISHGLALGTSRVYLRGQDLVFVQGGREKVNRGVEIIAGLLGPVGPLFGLTYRLWSKKAETAPAHGDEVGPEDSLHGRGSDFSIHVPEIRDAALEPPGRFTLFEEQAGRLNPLVRGGKTVKLDLPSADDVKSVLDVLAPLLKSNLRIKVEWDKSGHRFQKKPVVNAAAQNP